MTTRDGCISRLLSVVDPIISPGRGGCERRFYAHEGVKDIHNLHQRMEQNRASGDRLGTKVIGWYLAQGAYDVVVIVEAPDDMTMAAQVLTVASHGSTHTETLRLFTREETDQILEKVGDR